MTNANKREELVIIDNWEAIFSEHSLLPEDALFDSEDKTPEIQTWVRVYPAETSVKKGNKRP